MKNIILVEDDVAITDIYETMIKKAGMNVEVIGLGQEALRRLHEIVAKEKEKPDMMLLDLILPDINGMDVLAEIKKHPETKDIKVFILTNQEESEALISPGAKPDKFIIKANITPTQLLEMIKKELGA